MTAYTITVNLDDTAIAGCLEFTGFQHGASESVKRTLQAFIKTMQSKARLTQYDQETLDALMSANSVSEQLDDLFSDVRKFLDTSTVDAKVGEEVEASIAKASTPTVTKGTVEVHDRVATEITPEVQRVNLFDHFRRRVEELAKVAPKDRFIEQVMTLKKMWATGTPIKLEDKVFVASVEIVYTNLPRDLWGSLKAEMNIKDLMVIHDGSEPTNGKINPETD
jgi:hypothetical protein